MTNRTIHLRDLVRVYVSVIIVLAVATLVTFLIGEWKLLSFGSSYIPMAPVTAFLFIINSILIILQTTRLKFSVIKYLIIIGISLIDISSGYSIIHAVIPALPSLEETLFNAQEQVSGIPVGVMSPLTAFFFLFASLSFILGLSEQRRYRNISPLCAIGILAAGIIIVEGYWFNSPFLYGGTIVPVAWTTGFCFLLIGLSLLSLRSDDTNLGQVLFGPTVKARLLRTFLPVMILFVLITGWIYSLFVFQPAAYNPVLWTGIIAVISIGVIVIIVTFLSRQIGGVIDHAESERDRSEKELKKANVELSQTYYQLKKQGDDLLRNYEEITIREEELKAQNDELIQQRGALEQSESRYFELFEHISSGVIVYEAIDDGEEFIIRDMNKAVERIELIPRNQAIGRNVTEVFPGIHEYGMLDALKKVHHTRKPLSRPLSFYHDNRISGWRDNYIYPLPSGEIVTVYDDVTDKKRSEEELKNSEEKFRIVADYTLDWETWESPDGELLYISPSCEQITGFPPDEFRSKRISVNSLIHPDDLSSWEEHFLHEKTGNDHLSIDFRIIRRDGEERWISHVCQSIILPTGQNIGRRGSNRDITQEKITQEALRKREAQYQLISENTADVIWIFTLITYRIRYISPSVFKLRGYTPDEVMNQSLSDMLTPESFLMVSEHLAPRIAQVMAGDESLRVLTQEVDQPHKNGSIISTEVVTTLITGQNGEITEVLGVSRDIRERKIAEEKIGIAVSQITRNLETLAVLNDQIRNPLMIIELIASGFEGKEADIIHSEIMKIDELINQVDTGFLRSDKVRGYLIRHYNLPFEEVNQNEKII